MHCFCGVNDCGLTDTIEVPCVAQQTATCYDVLGPYANSIHVNDHEGMYVPTVLWAQSSHICTYMTHSHTCMQRERERERACFWYMQPHGKTLTRMCVTRMLKLRMRQARHGTARPAQRSTAQRSTAQHRLMWRTGLDGMGITAGIEAVALEPAQGANVDRPYGAWRHGVVAPRPYPCC